MLLGCKNHSLPFYFQANDLRLYNLVVRLAVISGLFAVIIANNLHIVRKPMNANPSTSRMKSTQTRFDIFLYMWTLKKHKWKVYVLARTRFHIKNGQRKEMNIAWHLPLGVERRLVHCNKTWKSVYTEYVHSHTSTQIFKSTLCDIFKLIAAHVVFICKMLIKR